ncbi:MAG: hypothetical protein PHC28_05880 [Flavobacterium sp.]|nr:hypothetical protein [Flavobacterium sp.]MDD5149998.1 hypothetical protein [Flavobacterium sp.]
MKDIQEALFNIGIIVLAVVIWIFVQIEISADNPCSQFSNNPNACVQPND